MIRTKNSISKYRLKPKISIQISIIVYSQLIFQIISKDNDLFITKTDAVMKNLTKEQKEKYLSAALTMTTAQNEMKVVQDVKKYFYELADDNIEPLLHKLAKKDPNLALSMQKKIIKKRYN